MMATLDPEDANRALNAGKKRSVQINDQKPEIIEIYEKRGPLHNAIPVMPLGLAIVCCILNICIPGMGTFISAFTVFCGATTRISTPLKACLLNVLAALLQMVSFLLIVGWIWSILWGMTFVQLRLTDGDEENELPYYVRRQSSVDVSHNPHSSAHGSHG